jgi:hypothetical protein
MHTMFEYLKKIEDGASYWDYGDGAIMCQRNNRIVFYDLLN